VFVYNSFNTFRFEAILSNHEPAVLRFSDDKTLSLADTPHSEHGADMRYDTT